MRREKLRSAERPPGRLPAAAGSETAGRRRGDFRPPGRRRATRRIPRQMARPKPGSRLSSRVGGAIELFEDPIQIFRRQTGTAVGDFDDEPAIGFGGAEFDRRARRRVLGRVLQQVDQHLFDQQLVHRHERQVARRVARPADDLRAAAPSAPAPRRRSPRSIAIPCGARAPRLRAASCPASSPPAGSDDRPLQNRLQQFAADVFGVERTGAVHQRAGAAGDHRQGSAQGRARRRSTANCEAVRFPFARGPWPPRPPDRRARRPGRSGRRTFPAGARGRADRAPVHVRQHAQHAHGIRARPWREGTAPERRASVAVPCPAVSPCSSTQRATA